MTNNMNGNTPSIKNSKSIDQTEIQNVKHNMNSTASKNMILGAELTSNVASLGNMSSSVPSLNSSTSVGTNELQNAKNEVQKSGSNKG